MNLFLFCFLLILLCPLYRQSKFNCKFSWYTDLLAVLFCDLWVKLQIFTLIWSIWWEEENNEKSDDASSKVDQFNLLFQLLFSRPPPKKTNLYRYAVNEEPAVKVMFTWFNKGTHLWVLLYFWLDLYARCNDIVSHIYYNHEYHILFYLLIPYHILFKWV